MVLCLFVRILNFLDQEVGTMHGVFALSCNIPVAIYARDDQAYIRRLSSRNPLVSSVSSCGC